MRIQNICHSGIVIIVVCLFSLPDPVWSTLLLLLVRFDPGSSEASLLLFLSVALLSELDKANGVPTF
jgi:hypothetical protein